MIPGTYSLRGLQTYDKGVRIVDANYVSPYYEANVETIKTAFGYATDSSRCFPSGNGASSKFYCRVEGLLAYCHADGTVNVSNTNNSDCTVDNDGSSNCGGW